MKFLDKKEQVLDTQLTPHGEYLLSIGKLKPEYYAFFDDNILYESQYGRPNESPERTQNSIEPRIQEETPQLETQTVFSDRDVFINSFIRSPDIIEGFIPITQNSDLVSQKEIKFDRDFHGPQYLLGTTDKLTQKCAAWSISLLRGEMVSSSDVFSGSNVPTLDIPQLNVTLSYDYNVIADRRLVSDTELAISFENGEILNLRPEMILAEISELNSDIAKGKFDIEVFEVKTETLVGNPTPEGSNEVKTTESLRRLKFRKTPSLVQNDILLDQSDILEDTTPLTPDNVEYYFYLRTDNQVSKDLICSSVAEIKRQGVHLDIDIECQDSKNISLVDIYSTDAASEPCPDLDDPCEDKPGTVY